MNIKKCTKDYVKCCNCMWEGTVEIGTEACPKCRKDGCLAWVDINKPETESTMSSSRTPGPWSFKETHPESSQQWYVIVDPEGRGPIMDVGGNNVPGQIAVNYAVDPETVKANAEFIVKACNAHDGLIRALFQALDFTENGIHRLDIITFLKKTLKDAGEGV